MKMVLLFFILFHSAAQAQSVCLYGITQCSANKACIKMDMANAQCLPLPNEIPEIEFPIQAELGVYCDQGNLSPDNNSHIYNNTAFALDLVSNRNSGPSSITASSPGLIVSYSECKTDNDQCGNGFGNHVQILRDDGFLLFYAHLSKVYVKTGDKVLAGDKIGVEGTTGWAGENHRHLHFSVHYNWKNMGFDMLKNNIGFLPQSTPFKMNICQPDLMNCGPERFLDSRKLECTRVSSSINWLKIR